MDRALATKERPLLNQGQPYIPDAGRTMEDLSLIHISEPTRPY